MIRFIDMRAADAPGHRFAFWDTVKNRFVCIVGYAWDTWADFEEERESVGSLLGDAYQLERMKELCPAWVFEPPPAEGVCYHCGELNEHEPEECPISIAEATRRGAKG